MKKIVYTLIFSLMSTLTFSQDVSEHSTNNLIICFKSSPMVKGNGFGLNQNFGITELDSLNQKFQIQTIKVIGNKKKQDTYVLTFQSPQDIKKLISEYQNLGLFEYVEPNYIGHGGAQQGVQSTTPDDALYARQYGLYNDGTFTLSDAKEDADIDMDLGWDLEKGDSTIIVAVLDAGVKLTHPEFKGRIWVNTKEIVNGKDDDNNGYIDDIRGWDFANEDNNPADDHGHGTNVAGIIGANGNNNLGYAGVDWNCKLMICKILDRNNSGLYSWWADAIYYAVDNGAKVINMSVGGSGFSAAMQTAINYANKKGVTVVACMMNENNKVTYYPAGYEHTIAVGSTNANDERSSPFFWSSTSGSNYGNHIDVVAPGNFIYGLNYQSNSNFESYWGGTSQATPLVAGLSSLLLAQDTSRTPFEIREIIRNTAEDQVGKASEDEEGFDNYYGYGRVNAYQALLQYKIVNAPKIKAVKFSVFPNPTSEFLYVQGDLERCNISISNLLGVEYLRMQDITHTKSLKLDISKFSAGFYVLKIVDKDEGSALVKKIVVE